MSPRARKILLALLVLVVAAAGAVVGVRFVLTSQSETADALREYVARRIVGIVNAHLEPTLGFDSVALELPLTVRFTGARLTARDGTDVLDIDMLEITLAEMPSIGKPIRIARIEISGGAINLIADPGTGGFKGLDPILKGGVREGTAPIASESQLSNVLRLDHITISDVALTYDDGTGSPPMEFRGFGADLAITPAEGGEGWYMLAVDAGRSPGLTVDLRGKFNINTFVAGIEKAVCEIDLDESTIASIPPQLQEAIRSMDARGHAVIEASGLLPLLDPISSELGLDVRLDDFNIAAGDLRLPIDSFEARIDLAGGTATMQNADARLIGGGATISATAALSEAGIPASGNWSLSDVSLREALRTAAPPGEMPKLAGRLNGRGSVNTMLSDAMTHIAGDGEVHVTEGRLFILPGIAEILQKIGQAAATGGEGFNHRGDATFSLDPAGVRVTQSEIVTGVLAARATGMIGYDGRLDMIVNAGPLERLQSALGAIGDLFARLTDRLIKYHLGGTVSDPTVTVMPLGIGG